MHQPRYFKITSITILYFIQELVTKFFNNETEKILVMQVLPSGVLIPYLGIQPGSKVKSSYFIRRSPVKITVTNYRDQLIIGDMSPKPIEELAILVEEVQSMQDSKLFYSFFNLWVQRLIKNYLRL